VGSSPDHRLVKRAQTVYGTLFTVSGVICAFRKRALHDAGWWSPAAPPTTSM
jgi:biofilm PGA synthesis N-glycosyltransferase PgaC